MGKYRHRLIICVLAVAIGFGQTTVAVIDFDARGIADHEANTITDWLRYEIVKLDLVKLIERGDMMAVIMEEQSLQLTGCTSDECAVQIGQLLGVSQIVSGSIGRLGSTYTIISRLIDVETGQAIQSSTLRYKGEIDGIVDKLPTFAYEVIGMKYVYDKILADREAERQAAEQRRVARKMQQEKATREDSLDKMRRRQKVEDYYKGYNKRAFNYGLLYTGVGLLFFAASDDDYRVGVGFVETSFGISMMIQSTIKPNEKLIDKMFLATNGDPARIETYRRKKKRNYVIGSLISIVVGTAALYSTDETSGSEVVIPGLLIYGGYTFLHWTPVM